MEYHSKTLGFIAESPQGEPPGQGGAELPASVREWYTEIDGRAILEKYSNGDHALAPSDFRLETVDGKRLAVFMIENQGVCWWGFDLDGGEDPAVYVNLDPPPDQLFEYSKSFSEFTFVRVFDHHGFWDPERFSLELCRPLRPEDLSVLREKFAEEPGSRGWPGTEVYRFRAPFGRITIWQSDEQSDWTLSGNTPDDLLRLRSSLDGIWRAFD